MVSVGIVIVIAVVAALLGAVGGFFLARKILPLMRICFAR